MPPAHKDYIRPSHIYGWTWEDETRARAEGWDLGHPVSLLDFKGYGELTIDQERLEIYPVAHDAAPPYPPDPVPRYRFNTCEEAAKHVRSKAAEGSELHRRALAAITAWRLGVRGARHE